MPEDEKMTIDERYKYLRICQRRYRKMDRARRSGLLNEMEGITGLDRKTLIRQMRRRKIERRKRCRQRGRVYDAKLDDALRVIAESLDYICAERLTPNLVLTAQHLAAHHELELSPELKAQLSRVSVSTVRRRLRVFANLGDWRLPRRKVPRPPNPALRNVTMKRLPWDERVPGHFETDLVHHCGATTGGNYVHTLLMTDVATGWCEPTAVLGRSQLVMEDGFRRILRRLPFPVLQVHPDNGSEFFNHHLVHFWKEAAGNVQLSRSRPFHKNDNRFVEQKNSSLIRAYLGYERLDSVAQTRALNDLYDQLWLYYNFFQPVLRLQDKSILLNHHGEAVFRRRHGPAQTPFQRLCSTHILSADQQYELQRLYEQTNPRRLREEIHRALDRLFRLPGASPARTENVLETLLVPKCQQTGAAAPVTFSFDRTITSQ